MPKIVSKAQSSLMQAAAHDPKVAKKTGVPQKVAKAAVSEAHGRKLKKLPEHVKKAKK